MNKLFFELKTLKLNLLDNNKVLVENYNSIKEVSTKSIIIDKYEIIGTCLSIELINCYQIILSGQIEKICIL